MAAITWTNASVLRFANGRDPVAAVEDAARKQVLKALDAGWKGPPFNPLGLADIQGIPVEASAEVKDARTVPIGNGVKIQFNPTQPRGRVRFSIAHEVAHTLFADVGDAVRNRGGDLVPDSWQLEMLCNIAAAEFVMPLGSLGPAERVQPLEDLMVERRKFDVSVEAFLMRAVKVAAEPVMVAFASAPAGHPAKYRLDYAISSRGWEPAAAQPTLPERSLVGQCIAVGHTARGTETWAGVGPVELECVGIPGYPGSLLPRVACLVRRPGDVSTRARRSLSYLHGDVLSPRGSGARLILMLVNDVARRWGGGLARSAAERFPTAERDFSEWIQNVPKNERLGQMRLADVGQGIALASLVSQEGFGPSNKPRIRYSALATALDRVGEIALTRGASVHMPRLGTGGAGGNWQVVEQIIEEALVARNINTIVYDPPPRQMGVEADLFA